LSLQAPEKPGWAWASKQSEPLPNRKELEDRVERFEKEFAGGKVPLPPFRAGFRLAPDSIEFWQGRASRLHDRIKFTRDEKHLDRARLYP